MKDIVYLTGFVVWALLLWLPIPTTDTKEDK
jgi:hypothetical protein